MSSTSIDITAVAKVFTGESARSYQFAVYSDGVVRVYDSIAGYYTTVHAMTARTLHRIRQLAMEVAS